MKLEFAYKIVLDHNNGWWSVNPPLHLLNEKNAADDMSEVCSYNLHRQTFPKPNRPVIFVFKTRARAIEVAPNYRRVDLGVDIKYIKVLKGYAANLHPISHHEWNASFPRYRGSLAQLPTESYVCDWFLPFRTINPNRR